MTKESSSRGAKRRGDLNPDAVILSNAKDLSINHQILRNPCKKTQEQQRHRMTGKPSKPFNLLSHHGSLSRKCSDPPVL